MSSPHKIVAIIDDEPEMRTAMAAIVSAFGYGAQTFDSAETFLVHASTCEAFCLLVDIQLGGISGVELAHRLAAKELKFPIFFMTGCDDPAIESQAAAAGGLAFFHKPFPAKMLIDAINKAAGTT